MYEVNQPNPVIVAAFAIVAGLLGSVALLGALLIGVKIGGPDLVPLRIAAVAAAMAYASQVLTFYVMAALMASPTMTTNDYARARIMNNVSLVLWALSSFLVLLVILAG